MAEKGRMMTGARARFSLNGVKVGYARNVALSEAIDYRETETLDNIEVEEFVPVGYRVTFSASTFRVIGETLKRAGWFPATGANTDDHLSNILVQGSMTATIEDSKTSRIIATVEQVKIASHNWTINARDIVGEDVEFVAIRVLDESEV